MEGFNGDGNDGHQFNDEGYASGLGSGFISGYTGGDFNSGYGDGGFNSGIDGGGHTRDFLSQPPSFSASGAHTSADAPPPGFPSSSNHTPSQLRLDSLDLNASQSWSDMHAYQGILQSGAQQGGSGSFAPPAVRVPSRSGRGSLGLRPPRGASGSGAAGRGPPRQRGSASGGGSGSTGRAARRRQEQPADDDMPAPQVPSRLDRAKWSPFHIKVFCKLYCEQIDLGYCIRGQMSKWGWKNITEQYFKETKLVHDNVIFGNKFRELKKEWSAIQKLQQKSTGLGRCADGSIDATDEWWEENSEDKECQKMKDGLPDYLPYKFG